MEFDEPLKQGVLVKRYKRFLADVETGNGVITMHCPNTGSMKNCAEPGYKVWYSTSSNPKRKYAQTWEIAEDFEGHRIGINTGNANKLVAEALSNDVIQELQGYETIRNEVKYGDEKSRIDFLLSSDSKPACYIEVKSVTLLDDGLGYFPDAVSERGRKHLRELMVMASEGHRAVLLFCVQHTGIKSVRAASLVDPAYAETLKEALQSGVEVLAYGSDITSESMKLSRPLPFVDE